VQTLVTQERVVVILTIVVFNLWLGVRELAVHILAMDRRAQELIVEIPITVRLVVFLLDNATLFMFPMIILRGVVQVGTRDNTLPAATTLQVDFTTPVVVTLLRLETFVDVKLCK
jgi:hypothetical protein